MVSLACSPRCNTAMNDNPRTLELRLVTLLEEKETVGMASSCSIVGAKEREISDPCDRFRKV